MNGGEQQRIAIGRALVTNPTMLPAAMAALKEPLKFIQASRGRCEKIENLPRKVTQSTFLNDN